MTPRTPDDPTGPRFTLRHPPEPILSLGPYLFRRGDLAACDPRPSSGAGLENPTPTRSRRGWRDPLEECWAIALHWDLP